MTRNVIVTNANYSVSTNTSLNILALTELALHGLPSFPRVNTEELYKLDFLASQDQQELIKARREIARMSNLERNQRVLEKHIKKSKEEIKSMENNIARLKEEQEKAEAEANSLAKQTGFQWLFGSIKGSIKNTMITISDYIGGSKLNKAERYEDLIEKRKELIKALRKEAKEVKQKKQSIEYQIVLAREQIAHALKTHEEFTNLIETKIDEHHQTIESAEATIASFPERIDIKKYQQSLPQIKACIENLQENVKKLNQEKLNKEGLSYNLNTRLDKCEKNWFSDRNTDGSKTCIAEVLKDVKKMQEFEGRETIRLATDKIDPGQIDKFLKSDRLVKFSSNGYKSNNDREDALRKQLFAESSDNENNKEQDSEKSSTAEKNKQRKPRNPAR